MKNRFTYRLLLILVLAVITAAGSSCVNSNSLCPEDQPGYVEGDNIWFTFKVRNLSPSSRADDSQGHPEEDALAAENYINIDDRDISVLLFANDNGNVWLMKVLTNDEYSVERASGADNSSLYNLSFKINRQYFAYAGTGDAKFSLMVVANMKGTGDYSDPLYNNNDHFAYSPQRLAALKLYYGMPDQSATTWLPSVDENRLIPMSGILPCTVSQTALQNSSDAYNPLNLGTVEMLRTMAKIRIIDKTYTDTQNNPYRIAKINSVTINGGNTRGAFLPDVDPQWFNRTVNVEAATEITDWFNSSLSTNFFGPTPQTSIVTGASSPNSFYCYIPETSLTDGHELVMNFNVTTLSGANRTISLTVRNAHADGVSGVTQIARNHIYEFEVKLADEFSAEINLNVADWDSEETIWDYSEVIVMNDGDEIKWTAGTYQPVDYTKAALVLLQDMTPAQCTFTLRGPLTATWRAYFVVESGASVPFNFIDADGNHLESISGTIDGSPVNLKITATDAAPRQLNRARLMVMVTLPDGRSMNADVLNGKYNDTDGSGNAKTNTYFTIIQNPQL